MSRARKILNMLADASRLTEDLGCECVELRTDLAGAHKRAAQHQEALLQMLDQVKEARSKVLSLEEQAVAIRKESVLRADADQKRIEKLEGENRRLAADSAALEVVKAQLDARTKERDQWRAEVERMAPQLGWEHQADVERLTKERNALRTEVAALQERLRTSIVREAEIGRQKSQTPKQHPVKVGEWVERTEDAYPGVPIGTKGKVVEVSSNGGFYDVDLSLSDTIDALGKSNCHGWLCLNCEPCDPPTEVTHDTPEGKAAAESVIRDDRKTEPKPGDTVRLVRVPTPEEWLHDDKRHCEWKESFGKPGDLATVLSDDDDTCPLCVGVELSNTAWVEWPLSCIEVVRAEPDEIKVGDVVEVVSSSGDGTFEADLNGMGTVTSFDTEEGCDVVRLADVPGKKNVIGGYVSLCDVRKVTT